MRLNRSEAETGIKGCLSRYMPCCTLRYAAWPIPLSDRENSLNFTRERGLLWSFVVDELNRPLPPII